MLRLTDLELVILSGLYRAILWQGLDDGDCGADQLLASLCYASLPCAMLLLDCIVESLLDGHGLELLLRCCD